METHAEQLTPSYVSRNDAPDLWRQFLGVPSYLRWSLDKSVVDAPNRVRQLQVTHVLCRSHRVILSRLQFFIFSPFTLYCCRFVI